MGLKDDLEAKKVVLQKSVSSINSSGNVNINGNNEKGEGKKGFKTISLIERFNCRVKDLFEILMDENKWRGFCKDFTHSNAKIINEENNENVSHRKIGHHLLRVHSIVVTFKGL